MAIAVSSLSIALQGIAEFLDGQFGEDVIVTIDTPLRAQERAKGAGDKHVLNLFFYRIAPSGFQAAQTPNDRFFIRIHALITAFPNEQNDDEDDADLRVLGHAIRVLSSQPVLPTIMPGPPGAPPEDFRHAGALDYRLQSILQAPSMEELNHIWTTQGGDLAYRLSAAYEFALIPIEPLELAEPPPPMRTGILDVSPNADLRDNPLARLGEGASAFPLAGTNPGDAPPVNWLPVHMFAEGQVLSSARSVGAGTADVELALAGPPGARAAIRINWTREDGTPETQPAQIFDIAAQTIDDSGARVTLALDAAAAGDRAVIDAGPLGAGDLPFPGAPSSNRLTLHVEAAP